MAISRRAVGLGLLTISAAATGGYLWLRDNPHIARYFGETHTYTGFIGGEKSAFVENPRVVGVLARHSGIVLDARRAGSVEMIREKALLDQKPQFLWPSSSVLVDIAKLSGLKISKEKTIFNSPIVIY